MRLDSIAARRMLLAAQGLLKPPTRPAARRDVLRAVRRMGALQIDTISVVARSPYFVLWSRLGEYDPTWLDQLLARGELFEYWSHAACFLPFEDYALYHPSLATGFPDHMRWLDQHAAVANQVRAAVAERGSVKSSDFKRTDGGKSAWWGWKQEKVALECLLTVGELMIARRDNFQRVYAPAATVLRGRTFPKLSLEEARRMKLIRAVACLGLTKASWISDYFRLKKTGSARILTEASEAGDLVRVEVEDWDEPGFVHPDNMKSLRSAAGGTLVPEVTTFLTPFDPIVWDRKRTRELFDFDYTIEVYTPGHKRQFGYFTLPILHRDAIVGRVDAKAHRAQGRFEVRQLHLEAGVRPESDLIATVTDALRRCASWHGTPEVFVTAHGDFAGYVDEELAA